MHSFKAHNLILNIWSTSASAELDTAANITEEELFIFFTLSSNVVVSTENVFYII